MRISSLEDAISPENQVRFIDAFVSFVDLSKLGFEVKHSKKKVGRATIPKRFLKSICMVILTE